MHFTDIDRGLIGAAGIVGGGLPAAVGAGLSAQLDGKGQVSAVFFGDGTVNIGAFHESMNIAQVWKLPVHLHLREQSLWRVHPDQFHHALRGSDRARQGLCHAGGAGGRQ